MPSDTRHHTDLPTAGADTGSDDHASRETHLLARLLSDTFTVTDMFRRLFLLEDFFEHVDFTESSGADLAHMLRERYGTSEDRTTAEAIAGWGNDSLRALAGEPIHETITTLKKEVAALPQIVLYVPLTLSDAEITDIGRWCRKEIDGRILLDVRVDPEAAGGCLFVWNDVLHDFSLRYFLQKDRTAFDALVATYLPQEAS